MINEDGEVDIRRDYRFDLAKNWEDNVEPTVNDQITPITVFDQVTGEIIGWKLHGWKPPPGRVVYAVPTLDTKDTVAKDQVVVPDER